MSIPNNTPKEYKCDICNKNYTTRQNLWKHTNKFHTIKVSIESKQIVNLNGNTQSTESKHMVNTNTNESEAKYKCDKCNTYFKYKQSKWRHSKKCIISNTENEDLKKENQEIKKELSEMKSMIAELLKTRKIHPKTLQKINNNLINTGSINSNNNTTIVKFGSVNINSVLTPKEVMGVLLKPFLSTEECINLIHFNDKRPEYNNIFITNLKDDLAYVYDGTKFTTVTKNDVIMELIENYAEQVEISFEENRDKMTESKIKCVENYLNLINSEKQYTDQHNKVYQNFKAYKIGDVKRLIYDKSDPKKFAMICKNIQNTEIEV
jgi:uncharacterized C2H2 Zn-finger protein